MGHFLKFWKQEYCCGLLFPPSGDQLLSELFTMPVLSWVALHDMTHRFIDLHKPLHDDKVVIHEGEIVKDRGVCQAAAHGVTKSWTQHSY